MSFCVAFGTLIRINTTDSKKVEDIKITDSILGLDDNENFAEFEIESIFYSNGESIYRFYAGDQTLDCSESHCIFCPETKTFKHAYELNIEDKIKGFDRNYTIDKIEIMNSQPVIGILLKNQGCYFANDILSHSQNAHPSFITQTVNNDNEFSSAVKTSQDSQQSCVTFGTKINISETETKNAEDLMVGDFVFGPVSLAKSTTFRVKEKTIISNQIVYALYCLESKLECSENHCIFSYTDNTFRKVWQIKAGDYIKTINGIEKVEKIIAKTIVPVVSLQLENDGCYYANNILSHSQTEPPNYDFSIFNPPSNSNVRYLQQDATKTDIYSNNVMPSRKQECFTSSGIHEATVVKTHKGNIKASKLTTEHKIVGIDCNFAEKLMDIIITKHSHFEVLQVIFNDESSLKISKHCCVFSLSQNSYVNAFRLKNNEQVKFENEIKTVKNIILIGEQKIYSLKLAENIGFYANGCLVHNQDVALTTKNDSIVSKNEINKILKPCTKSIVPMWKYQKSKEWRQAFYLQDFNLQEEIAGYSFSENVELSVKIDCNINEHFNDVIIIKVMGSACELSIHFNTLKINASDIISWQIEDANYYFMKLNSLNTSSDKVSFNFDFSSKKESLLTHLNFIKLDDFKAISDYFQGYEA